VDENWNVSDLSEQLIREAYGIQENLPYTWALDTNYPNPFNPATEINYSLAKAGQINLAVYNILGEQVAVLVDGFQDAGHYSVTFDASQLSSGVYFYVLEADGFRALRKMLFAK